MKYVLTTDGSVFAYSSLKCSQIKDTYQNKPCLASFAWSGSILSCADLRHDSFFFYSPFLL